MKTISVIWKIINLNLKKYKIVEFKEKSEKILEFHIQAQWEFSCCPNCWVESNKRQDLKEYKQKKNLKHMVLSDGRVIEIKPIKRFFRCTNCWSKFLERFEFESPHWFHTLSFENYVLSSWWYLSWTKIAELSFSKSGRIYWILKHVDASKLNENGIKILEELDEIYLWVDEHSFSGNDMILVITEIKTKQLVALLPKITKESLEWWIQSLPLKIQIKVKGFSTDMNKGYKKSLEKIIWNPVFSVDKYHVFQEVNRMVDDVRQLNIWLVRMNFVKLEDIIKLWKIPQKLTKKEIQSIQTTQKNNVRIQKYKQESEMRLKPEQFKNQTFTNKKWEKMAYSEITQEYYQESWYRTLFLKREKNLSPLQKVRISQIFRDFDYNWYLAEAWNIKEDFMNAMDERDMKKIDEIIKDCRESEHHRLQQFARTLNNWYDWIKGYCEHSTDEFTFTNAFSEAYNNTAKTTKKQAHWFKIKNSYFKKLWLKEIYKKAHLFSTFSTKLS